MEDKKVIKDLKERNDKLKQQYDYNNIHLISLEKRYNNLKQEKEDLIKWLEEQIEYNSKLYLSNVRYEKVCEDVLSKLKGYKE